MKLKVHDSYHSLKSKITKLYESYDQICSEQVSDDTYLLVIEKFFFRNSSRASLTVLITAIDEFTTSVYAIGSGGGTGFIFRFDWGAKESFEAMLTKMLTSHHIRFDVLT
jgi:hypothetical protein